ncbi:unnamed protein product, partial [Symbiodinium microadriaticum]
MAGWREIDELPAPALQKEYATFDLPKVAEKEQRTRVKKVAYWDALPFNALREECWNMGMRSAYFNSADFHGRRERLIREAIWFQWAPKTGGQTKMPSDARGWQPPPREQAKDPGRPNCPFEYMPPPPQPMVPTHIRQHLQTLLLPPNASLRDVKAAYKKLALKYHPDKNSKDMEDLVTQRFTEIRSAYDELLSYFDMLSFETLSHTHTEHHVRPWMYGDGTCTGSSAFQNPASPPWERYRIGKQPWRCSDISRAASTAVSLGPAWVPCSADGHGSVAGLRKPHRRHSLALCLDAQRCRVADAAAFGTAAMTLEQCSRWSHSTQLLATTSLQYVVRATNAVLAACKDGGFSRARSLFASLGARRTTPDVVTYNSIISCSTGSRWPWALWYLYILTTRSAAQPTEATFASAIHACATGTAWRRALALLGQLTPHSLQPTTVIFGACIDACAKARQWHRAAMLLQIMPSQSLVANTLTTNALLTALATGSRWQEALSLFEGADKDGGSSPATYGAACAAMAAGAVWRSALDLLDLMHRRSFARTMQVWHSAQTACSNTGQWTKVLQLLEEASCEVPLDLANYLTALASVERGGCAHHISPLLRRIAGRGYGLLVGRAGETPSDTEFLLQALRTLRDHWNSDLRLRATWLERLRHDHLCRVHLHRSQPPSRQDQSGP